MDEHGYVWLSDDHLIFDFPFDRAKVDRIKKIRGAKWDKVSRVWRIPATSAVEARDFAAQIGLKIDPEVLKLNIPQHPNPGKGVFLSDIGVFLSFGYDPVKVRSVKHIPGITWDAASKAWKAPVASLPEVVRWAETFRESISDDVLAARDALVAEMSSAADASRATGLSIDLPEYPWLLPYQRAGVDYARKRRRLFIADEMGLGKTLQAIVSLELMAQETSVWPTVVACPSNLTLNWVREWQKWVPERRVAAVRDRKNFPGEGTYDVVVVGYGNFTSWETLLKGHRAYVFDESHYLKNATAQRTRSAIKITRRLPKEVPILCLTGTPVTSRPAEYAAQLEIMGKIDTFGGRWGFYRRYCNAHRDGFGKWVLTGHSHLEELNDRLRSTCYIRRTKDQVLTELPPVMHSTVILLGSGHHIQAYRRAEEDLASWMRDSGGSSDVPTHLARISVLRRLAAEAKMVDVVDLVQSKVDSGLKVVVAAHHRDIVNALAAKFGGLKIQGGMSVDDVEDAKRRFQDLSVEESPVIVISIQAAKTGHTLTAAQDIVFMELPWTPADVQQTYSRLHRIGQPGSVTATYALLESSIDEEIMALIEKKRDVVAEATGGAMELEVVRRMASRLGAPAPLL
jgi:SNF2 family DNA or RNA helicase